MMLGGVAVLALGIRLGHVLSLSGSPFLRGPVGDAARYLEWASGVAHGRWLCDAPFYQAPLYPYLLGAYFQFVDASVVAVLTLQAMWGAAACVLLALGTWRWFGRSAGALAGVMLAAYAPAVFYDSIVQKASLDGLLVCALLAAWPVFGEVRAWRSAGIGAMAGLLCLTRENALVWLPLLLLGLTWRRAGDRGAGGLGGAARGSGHRGVPRCGTVWGGRAGVAAAYGLGVGSALSPAVVHNRLAGREWVLTTSQAGANFYIGNHRGADGRYVPLAPGRESPDFERDDAKRLAELGEGRSLSAREVSRYWFKRAWSDIRSDLGGWARLVGLKVLMTWNRYEVADAEGVSYQASLSPVLGVVTRFWHFGALAPLAAAGVVWTWSLWGRLWVAHGMIALMTVAVAAFYVLGRYRQPIALLLIPFAAAGVVNGARLLGRRAWRAAGAGALAAVLAGAVANARVHDESRLDGLAWMNAGVAHARLGEAEAAVACFEESVRRHPTSSEANYNLGMALALGGDWAEAIERYEASLRGGKALPGIEFNLGVAYERAGRRGDAARMYEAAVSRDPADGEARAALQRLRGGG